MIRRLALGGLAAMSALWLTASAALAASNPPAPATTVNCGASGCLAGIGVTLTGPGAGPGNTSSATVNVPPPLCWYSPPTMTEPAAYTMEQNYGKGSPGAPPILFTDWTAIRAQILALHNQDGGNPPGLWYSLNGQTNNPAASKCLYGDPSFLWVPAGNPVPQPPVPPQTLALYALKRLTLPKPAVTLNPAANKSVVNLPTFVKIAAPAGAVNGQIYATATVQTLNGPESVTVAVTEKSVGISPGNNGTAYTGGCGPAGSKETAAQMNAAGVGAKPDCGVLYQQPSGAAPFPLSVTQTWMATAYPGAFVPGKQGNLLPVAQRGPLQSPASVLRVLVKEIQSVNG